MKNSLMDTWKRSQEIKLKTGHTATPWHIDSDLPPNGRSVFARVGDIPISGSTNGPHKESDRTNAEFIVKCVNNFEAYAEIVEGIARQGCMEQKIGEKCICWPCKARAAILSGQK